MLPEDQISSFKTKLVIKMNQLPVGKKIMSMPTLIEIWG